MYRACATNFRTISIKFQIFLLEILQNAIEQSCHFCLNDQNIVVMVFFYGHFQLEKQKTFRQYIFTGFHCDFFSFSNLKTIVKEKWQNSVLKVQTKVTSLFHRIL